MMHTDESRDTKDEEGATGVVTLHEWHAEVGPLVWFWDGHRWQGPEGTGDYDAAPSHAHQ